MPVAYTTSGIYDAISHLVTKKAKEKSKEDGAPVSSLAFSFTNAEQDAKGRNPLPFIASALAFLLAKQSNLSVSQDTQKKAEQAYHTPLLRAQVENVWASKTNDMSLPLWPRSITQSKRRPIKGLTQAQPVSMRISRTSYKRDVPLNKTRKVNANICKTFNELAKDWKKHREYNLKALEFELAFAKAARDNDEAALKKLYAKNSFYYASVHATFFDKQLFSLDQKAEGSFTNTLTPECKEDYDDYVTNLDTYIETRLKPWLKRQNTL